MGNSTVHACGLWYREQATAYRYPWGGGGDGSLGSSPAPVTHPHQKILPREKHEIYQKRDGGPKWEVNFKHAKCFFGL